MPLRGTREDEKPGYVRQPASGNLFSKQAQYQRLRSRCGSNRAIVAVAHSILQSIYYLLARNEPYRDLGAAHFDKLRPAQATKRLVARLEQLGYQVTLQTQAAA